MGKRGGSKMKQKRRQGSTKKLPQRPGQLQHAGELCHCDSDHFASAIICPPKGLATSVLGNTSPSHTRKESLHILQLAEGEKSGRERPLNVQASHASAVHNQRMHARCITREAEQVTVGFRYRVAVDDASSRGQRGGLVLKIR